MLIADVPLRRRIDDAMENLILGGEHVTGSLSPSRKMLLKIQLGLNLSKVINENIGRDFAGDVASFIFHSQEPFVRRQHYAQATCRLNKLPGCALKILPFRLSVILTDVAL